MGVANAIDITPGQRKELLGLLSRHLPGVAVWAFGSRVKWTARPDSDLDLVVFSAPGQKGRVAALKEAIEESSLPFRVDLLVWDEIPETFRENIRQAYVSLVEKSEGKSSSAGKSEWASVPLASLVEPGRSISYGIVQPGSHDEAGVPIIRVGDIRDGRIASSDPLMVSAEIEAAYVRTRLKGGELLLTLVGTVGETAVVPEKLSGWNVARAVAVIPVKNDIGAYWVSLALKAAEAKEIMYGRLNTTVQATLNLRDVSQLPILLPEKTERERIAHILGTLDDKIELNRRMNETLEAMARAIFKSWFVDFDPVRAKASGEPPESICHRLGLTPDVLALFPDSLQDSELGEIPAGWSIRSLDDVADFLNGLALQKYPATGDEWLPVIKIAQLRAGHTLGADRANNETPPAYVIENGDVLFSWSGSLEIEIWCGGQGALNQHLFKVSSKEFPKWFYFLWTRHHLKGFRDIAANKATTMGHIQRKHLTEAKALCPSKKSLAAMGATFDPLISKIINGRLETNELAALRDILLPKLLSGELSPNHVSAESLQ